MLERELFIRSITVTPPENTHTYPFNLPIVRHLKTLQIKQPVTFFVGENGSGKSTLLEAIAVAYGFNAEGGSKHLNFQTKATHSTLASHIRLAKGIIAARDGFFLRAESFYNVASKYDEIEEDAFVPHTSYGGTSLHEMSHGESFLTLASNRFFGNGLYILDEPESALSPMSQFALLSLIHELVVKKKSQFIIATHSPILLAYPNATIYAFDETGIEKTAYTDTEHYILYKNFLESDRMLHELLRLNDD
jgi:predicted ATPase